MDFKFNSKTTLDSKIKQDTEKKKSGQGDI